MNITKDIQYVGIYDRQIDLFEGQYPVKNGVTYNSYIINDAKTAVMDGVDGRFSDEWLNGVVQHLHGKKPDYIVVHHMEPDHGASIEAFLQAFPEAKMVATAQAIKVAENYFIRDLSERAIAVKEGDKLELGRHTLHFMTAPMVHWPEVMVSYDDYDNALFSADAFGKFGPFEGDEIWTAEARRYYFGIVGKFGIPVQSLLKKVSKYPVAMICPLHGPVIKETMDYCVDLYKKWSTYTPERDGVTIAYASIYGGTKGVVEELVRQLDRKGQRNIVVHDLARCDHSEALADAFRYPKLVLASPTINANVFPAVKNFITALTDHNYQNRFISFIETGMWSPCSGKCMADLLRGCKGVTFDSVRVKIVGRADDEEFTQLMALATEIASK